MAEDTKMGFDSDTLDCSCEVGEFGEMGIQKISISDQRNSLQDRSKTSDSFVVDMESLSRGIDKDINANHRISLQRNLSRKGSQRGDQRNSNSTATERDTIAPTRGAALIGAFTPEIPYTMVVGTTDPINPQGQQIKITTTTSTTESKCSSRRYATGVGRRSHSWLFDPRRILLFFATLSSMGTIILIYFTLSISKLNGDGNSTPPQYW